MPSRDRDGKELGGAEKKRRKRERQEAEAPVALPEDDGKWAADFRAAGKPDLENPGTDLDYVRKLQLIALHQMATTPFPSAAQRNCWQRIREMSAVVGMTSNRAQLEAQVRRLEKALAERRQSGAIVKVQKGSVVKRPSTARGAAPPGPRAVPEDATVTPEVPEE